MHAIRQTQLLVVEILIKNHRARPPKKLVVVAVGIKNNRERHPKTKLLVVVIVIEITAHATRNKTTRDSSSN